VERGAGDRSRRGCAGDAIDRAVNRLPTTDLYFRDACAGGIAHWWRAGPIRALGQNTFRCGETLLLLRRDTPVLMRRALQWPGRLIYLIDDDIGGSLDSPGLPDDYRRRLATFDREYHQPLVERADHLVVASPVLQKLFGGDGVTAIDPFWSLPLADLGHFADVGAGSPVRLVHLGSGSHKGGLTLLEPALLRLLDGGRNVTFTFVGRRGEHPGLDAHRHVRRIAPRRWPAYRHWLRGQRFHIGLYPLTDTPFDRARSANKLIEHGIVGAVGVYPGDWPPARRMGTGAIIAPDAPGDWFETIAGAVDDLPQLGSTAGAALRRLPAINNVTMQRRIWSTLLDIAM
jgi:hypothetical protein